jgi:hypothetical protein
MAQLNSDYLYVQGPDGKSFPCSAEAITIELICDKDLDHDIVIEAASAIVYYFKHELGRDHITIHEFSDALEHVLKRFGHKVSRVDFVDESPEQIAFAI